MLQYKRDKVKKIIYENNHSIKNELISPRALSVIKKLVAAGYEAYLVGGCVRDILMKKNPKDFDVATNATPTQVKAIFRKNSRLIGKRFIIVHVTFDNSDEIVEVTTFRKNSEQSEKTSPKLVANRITGMLIRDNNFGTIEDDVKRRDFTINALYYDPIKKCIIDFENGIEDLNKGRIDIIGDPLTRYTEDPVRILRALRFSAKLDLPITKRTEIPLRQNIMLVKNVNTLRMFDEMGKMFLLGYAQKTFKLMNEYGVLKLIFPSLVKSMEDENEGLNNLKFIQNVFVQTDKRVSENKNANISFLYACLMWPSLKTRLKGLLVKQPEVINKESEIKFFKNCKKYNSIAPKIIYDQQAYTGMPKYIISNIINIWTFQFLLQYYRLLTKNDDECTQIIYLVLNHPSFRACLDFLQYRSTIESYLIPEFNFWNSNYSNLDKFKKIYFEYKNNNDDYIKNLEDRFLFIHQFDKSPSHPVATIQNNTNIIKLEKKTHKEDASLGNVFDKINKNKIVDDKTFLFACLLWNQLKQKLIELKISFKQNELNNALVAKDMNVTQYLNLICDKSVKIVFFAIKKSGKYNKEPDEVVREILNIIVLQFFLQYFKNLAKEDKEYNNLIYLVLRMDLFKYALDYLKFRSVDQVYLKDDFNFWSDCLSFIDKHRENYNQYRTNGGTIEKIEDKLSIFKTIDLSSLYEFLHRI